MARLITRTSIFPIISILLVLQFGGIFTDNGSAVRLIQPSARSSERGFGIVRNAEAPCPTTRQISDAKNYVKSGKEIEFIWFNPTAVQGPFRIQLLNANYELIATLLDSDRPGIFETNGLSKTRVEIPDTECKDCVLRLVQETADGKTQLLSCADVEVLSTLPSHVKGCEGDNCTVECTTDDQCGTGSCVKGSCYCPEGYYGPACLKESRLSPRQLDLSTYASSIATLDSKNKLYWKIENDSIEVVLKFPTNSWTVFGVKSPNAGDKCPWVGSPLDKKKQQKSESQEGNTLTGFDKIKIQRINDSKILDSHSCGQNEIFSNCPEYSRECEASCDWTAFPESIPSCPRACGAPRCACDTGFVRISNAKSECVPFNACQEDVAVECPQNETWAKCGVACEPSCESMYETTPCSHKCDQPACTCADNYVRLNGECIFWSSCPNLEQKILSPFEPSTSPRTPSTSTTPSAVTPPDEPPTTILDETPAPATTPTPTSKWLTEEPVTVSGDFNCAPNETVNECGKICEADCSTIFVRDDCKECEKPACACTQGYARNGEGCVYWGDCPLDGSGLETVAPKSTIQQVLEMTKPTAAPKVKAAAVKSASVEKGSAERIPPKAVSFVEPAPSGKSQVVGDVCFGEWRWPRNCRSNCDYKLSWTFNDESDEIEFSLETRISNNWWSGVGFSKDGSMKNADFVVVKNAGGALTLHDMFSYGYGTPVEDAEKNVYSPTVIGSFVNGVLRSQFTRKRITGDNSTDVEFTDSECFHFLFPVAGGRLDGEGKVLKHLSTPHVSPHPVCVRSCSASQDAHEKEAEPTCQNEYKFPENCQGDECEYVARWNLDSSKDEVRFEVTSRGIGRWTGIGISKDGGMANSDVYTGWVYNGKAFVVDRFAYGRQLPAIDPADRQDLFDVSGKIEDDYQTISFTRKVKTKDNITDFSLEGCYYFLFPIGGGRVLARRSEDFQNARTPIGYHDLNEPKVSKTKICICDEHEVPIAAVPTRVRARRQAVNNPFENRPVEPLTGLPDMARIGQISIAELTGKAVYDVKMDPFACSDVTVMKVLDSGESRVVDAFAQSKYGLEPDEFFGGQQSYRDVSASADGGVATVRFVRSMKASDVADHDFLTGQSQVFWANGPSDESPVRLSGAAHVETLFVDFFDNSKAPVIADLEDGENDSEQQHVAVTVAAVPTTVEVEPTESTVTVDDIVEATTEEMTTEWTTSPEVSTAESEAATVSTRVPEGPTTESNFIDEPDSAESGNEVPSIQIQPPRIAAPEATICHGSFAHPPKCTDQCTYVVSWQTDGANAHFQLWSQIKTQMWTGIGFSTEGGMMNADAIIASVLDDGTVTVTDQFSPGYGRPVVDESQDVFAVSTVYENGQLRANFSRSLSTTDAGNDVDLQECQFFLFTHSGGQLEGGSGDLRKHMETPISSGNRVCLGRCGAKEETPSESTPIDGANKKQHKPDHNNVQLGSSGPVYVPPLKPPTHFVYDAVLRFTNLDFTNDLEDMNSESSKKMSAAIKDKIGALLKEKFPQLTKFDVVRYAQGSVKSLIRMEFDGVDSPTPKEVEAFLKELAAKGKVGELEMDPKQLVLKENKTVRAKEEDIQLKNFTNWAMLIGALLVITVIFILALCCCCIKRKKRQTYPAEPLSFSQPMHKPYMGAYMSEPIYDVRQEQGHANGQKHGKKAISSPTNSSPKPHHPEETPKGMGETTYQEWYTKVASRDAPSHHQESTLSAAASRPTSRMSGISGPYISYPHESGYYTLGGEHRVPPPSYYRQY